MNKYFEVLLVLLLVGGSTLAHAAGPSPAFYTELGRFIGMGCVALVTLYILKKYVIKK